MFKLFTNKNRSYKHNEQINNPNIDNSEGIQYNTKTWCLYLRVLW